MTLTAKIRSVLLSTIFSHKAIALKRWTRETWRRLTGQKHIISVFLQIDDPYSYILSHYLPHLVGHYDIELRLYLSQAIGDDYQPAPGMLAEYAVADCVRMARELGIPFLDKGDLPPTEHRVGMSDSLASLVGTQEFDEELLQALAAYWRGDSAAAASISNSGESHGNAKETVERSRGLLQKLGHYSSAMLHYSGEWYWGVDRLHYLTERLNDLGAAKTDSPNPQLASIRQAASVSLPIKPPAAAKELPPIEFFFSIRSPYSYLALKRTIEVANAFGIKLIFRPVLPMVMRGMKVPMPKLLYIAMDATREAQRQNIPFGRVADPVGKGVERVLAVQRYAESEKKNRDFLLNAGVAIWAEATDVSTDKGMRKVTGATGLFWPDVVNAMSGDEWRESVERNRESMTNAGSWGVPTIRMGDYVAWGQDRDWMLVRHIEELCDTGDGILV